MTDPAEERAAGDPLCRKRGYESERAARLAHRSAGWRVRTYRCLRCDLFHATNHEKNGGRRDRRRWKKNRKDHRRENDSA